MTLFENIKALRVEKDWTQGDLAKFAGVSIETIKRYENGKTNPTNDNLSKIANALGVEIRNLYDGASPSVSKKCLLVSPTLKKQKRIKYLMIKFSSASLVRP